MAYRLFRVRRCCPLALSARVRSERFSGCVLQRFESSFRTWCRCSCAKFGRNAAKATCQERDVNHGLRQYLSGNGIGAVLVKAVAGSAGLRIAGMGFGFLVGVQLARGLGAEGYGIYGVAMSIIALLTVPTEFGLPQLLTREVAAAHVKQDWGRMKGILGWSTRGWMRIAAAVGAAVMAWLLLAGQGLRSTLGSTLLVGLLMVPLVALVALRSAALRGLQLIVRGQVPDVLLR